MFETQRSIKKKVWQLSCSAPPRFVFESTVAASFWGSSEKWPGPTARYVPFLVTRCKCFLLALKCWKWACAWFEHVLRFTPCEVFLIYVAPCRLFVASSSLNGGGKKKIKSSCAQTLWWNSSYLMAPYVKSVRVVRKHIVSHVKLNCCFLMSCVFLSCNVCVKAEPWSGLLHAHMDSLAQVEPLVM